MLHRRTIRDRLVIVAAVPILILVAVAIAALVSSEQAIDPRVLGIGAGVGAAVVAATVAVVGRSILTSVTDVADDAGRMAELMEKSRAGDAPLTAPSPLGRPADLPLAATVDAVNRMTAVLANDATVPEDTVREGLSTIVVNLARRNQSLLDRQVEFLDRLEVTEEDPARLDELFKIDHLATRMRRNAESLLVLADAEPGRRKGEPVEVADVLRVAMGEVEAYARIDLVDVDEGHLGAGAAIDLAHLTAELMENATQFSSPETRVTVVGRFERSDRFEITIADEGMGMTDDQLAVANRIVTEPPELSLDLGRSLGLVVVGRLARRLGVAVALRRSESGGTLASLTVPGDLFVTRPRRPDEAEPEAIPVGGPAATPEAAGSVAASPPVAAASVESGPTSGPGAPSVTAVDLPPVHALTPVDATPNGSANGNGNGSGNGSTNGSSAQADLASLEPYEPSEPASNGNGAAVAREVAEPHGVDSGEADAPRQLIAPVGDAVEPVADPGTGSDALSRLLGIDVDPDDPPLTRPAPLPAEPHVAGVDDHTAVVEAPSWSPPPVTDADEPGALPSRTRPVDDDPLEALRPPESDDLPERLAGSEVDRPGVDTPPMPPDPTSTTVVGPSDRMPPPPPPPRRILEDDHPPPPPVVDPSSDDHPSPSPSLRDSADAVGEPFRAGEAAAVVDHEPHRTAAAEVDPDPIQSPDPSPADHLAPPTPREDSFQPSESSDDAQPTSDLALDPFPSSEPSGSGAASTPVLGDDPFRSLEPLGEEQPPPPSLDDDPFRSPESLDAEQPPAPSLGDAFQSPESIGAEPPAPDVEHDPFGTSDPTHAEESAAPDVGLDPLQVPEPVAGHQPSPPSLIQDPFRPAETTEGEQPPPPAVGHEPFDAPRPVADERPPAPDLGHDPFTAPDSIGEDQPPALDPTRASDQTAAGQPTAPDLGRDPFQPSEFVAEEQPPLPPALEHDPLPASEPVAGAPSPLTDLTRAGPSLAPGPGHEPFEGSEPTRAEPPPRPDLDYETFLASDLSGDAFEGSEPTGAEPPSSPDFDHEMFLASDLSRDPFEGSEPTRAEPPSSPDPRHEMFQVSDLGRDPFEGSETTEGEPPPPRDPGHETFLASDLGRDPFEGSETTEGEPPPPPDPGHETFQAPESTLAEHPERPDLSRDPFERLEAEAGGDPFHPAAPGRRPSDPSPIPVGGEPHPVPPPPPSRPARSTTTARGDDTPAGLDRDSDHPPPPLPPSLIAEDTGIDARPTSDASPPLPPSLIAEDSGIDARPTADTSPPLPPPSDNGYRAVPPEPPRARPAEPPTAAPTTGAGLAKRTPGASLPPIGEGRPIAPSGRTPGEIRTILSRYRDGLRDGRRRERADEPTDWSSPDGPNRPIGPHGPTPSHRTTDPSEE